MLHIHCLPACQPTCLPACYCLPACLSACLPAYLPACLPACLPTCYCLLLPARFHPRLWLSADSQPLPDRQYVESFISRTVVNDVMKTSPEVGQRGGAGAGVEGG